ncbi:hypothetical protein [Peribacillus sp. SCS-155]
MSATNKQDELSSSSHKHRARARIRNRNSTDFSSATLRRVALMPLSRFR